MGPYQFVAFNHPLLRQKLSPITDFTDALREQLNAMLAMIYRENGVGLAANQIGFNQRLFVMDASADRNAPICAINPEITASAEETETIPEGCFSLPGLSVPVTRPIEVTVRYQNEWGEWQKAAFNGLAARCFQHELDHLNGRLAIDHLSGLKRQLAIKKLHKLTKLEALSPKSPA